MLRAPPAPPAPPVATELPAIPGRPDRPGATGTGGTAGATGPTGPTAAPGATGPAGLGLDFTTATGIVGPTFTRAGTYFVDVEVEFNGTSTGIIGVCYAQFNSSQALQDDIVAPKVAVVLPPNFGTY